MLLLRFSSNATPRIFFVTTTSRITGVTRSATCLPLRSFDRVQSRYGTKNDGEEQHGGRHGKKDRSRRALSHSRLGRLLGADSRGFACQAPRRVLSPADRLWGDAPACDGPRGSGAKRDLHRRSRSTGGTR